MKNIKQHFVFDLDDTLTDSYEFNQQMFVETFRDYLDLSNLEVDSYLRDVHLKNRGISMHLLFEQTIKYFSLNIDPNLLVKRNEDKHKENADKIKLFPAVVEVIKDLKARDKEISLMSNRQTESLRKILRKHRLTHYFSNIVSCYDEGHEKPDPYCLNKIIKESGKNKNSFIYFGDSKTDYEFATSAGIDCIIIDHYLNQKKFYKMIIETFM